MVRLKYLITSVEFETGVRLRNALPHLKAKILLMYCDNICPVDFARLCADYEAHQPLIQLSAKMGIQVIT